MECPRTTATARWSTSRPSRTTCSFFPGTTVAEFADRLRGFKTSKGTIQFTPDHPLPEDLVRAIVRRRIEANDTRAASRGGRK